MDGLAVLLEERLLRLPKGSAETATLVRELSAMELRGGKMHARGSGHDDLVLALALACWVGRKEYLPMFSDKRLPGIPPGV